jgi:uncharacterized protein
VTVSRVLVRLRNAILIVAGLFVLASPAAAQFSQGYKFLEAVKKKEGQTVEDMLNEPGSTVINTRDVTSGESAMHIVTARRDLTWMNFLLAKGANANARNGRGETPLQLAARMAFLEGVELLIAKQARIDEPNSGGETPLIAAVHSRNTDLMRLLLKAGADPDRADNSGRSARDYALADGRTGPLIAEIQASAKPKGQRAGARASYGPSF